MNSIPGEAEITITGLKKTFRDLIAVDNISFEVCKGEIFGLLGPNGAGKTTTINMICGLLPATAGTIKFQSHDIREIRSIIGYCPQENIYFPKLTCLEQLVFMGNIYGIPSNKCKSDGMGLLDMLGLINKAKVYARNLSGGMKRRLNIALALIHDPRILNHFQRKRQLSLPVIIWMKWTGWLTELQ
jgi:ABC-2 type transport system ATP-binding protein